TGTRSAEAAPVDRRPARPRRCRPRPMPTPRAGMERGPTGTESSADRTKERNEGEGHGPWACLRSFRGEPSLYAARIARQRGLVRARGATLLEDGVGLHGPGVRPWGRVRLLIRPAGRLAAEHFQGERDRAQDADRQQREAHGLPGRRAETRSQKQADADS